MHVVAAGFEDVAARVELGRVWVVLVERVEDRLVASE
jgi:hypothetical protein